MSLKSETKCKRSKVWMASERTNKRHLLSTLILHPQVYFSQYMKGQLRIIKEHFHRFIIISTQKDQALLSRRGHFNTTSRRINSFLLI